MTYWGFLRTTLRAFSGGRTERDYPDHATWIADSPHA
jgi:hypothetical protein